MASDTKIRILDAAEALFASQGFTQTSLRAITARADVNLASVNYHFGSKKNLIQAVFTRYFDVLMPQIDTVLSHHQSQNGVNGVESLLSALVQPMMTLSDRHQNGTALFVQLLGRGYSETQGHLRRFIMMHYGGTVAALMHELHGCLPALTDAELFWRVHFAIGSFVFSMASGQALSEIAQADFNQKVDVESVILRLVPFVSQGIAGIRA